MERKKKVLFHSNYCGANTGFGRYMKEILAYLYKTNKYEICLYAAGMPWEHPEFNRWPWKVRGTLPNNPQELHQINRDPHMARMASYGVVNVDRVIEEFKPDIYIGVEDIWAFDNWQRRWWNKFPCVIHTTLDSLPILQLAVDKAKDIKNYWVWSEFAEKGLHALGHKHVKTVHGCLNVSQFNRLRNDEREALRKRLMIPNDSFIIGFVFRNQLRKSVPNLLEGYAAWKKNNNIRSKTFLLTLTHYSEGWNIHRLADQYGVNKNEILCVYICRACGNYEVRPFSGQDQNCRHCQAQKSLITCNVQNGISEEQLNEVYNLMDVYCHPFTSGGQEIPIQEAKLTGLITLVTNYSCGEDLCVPEAHSLPLEWTKYTEHGTEFIKASTTPQSIAKQLQKVYVMKPSDRLHIGLKARDWTIKNYGTEAIGKIHEAFIDAQPFSTYDYDFKTQTTNPDLPIPQIQDNVEWLLFMYKNILIQEEGPDGDGVKYWLSQLNNGVKREDIERFFRKTAVEKGGGTNLIKFDDLLRKDDKKRVLYVMPRSIGDIFLSTSLFESIRNRYPRPEWTFYVAVEKVYKDKGILEGNPYVDEVIDYIPQMNDIHWLEGAGAHKGFFDVAYLPHATTQLIQTYQHRGIDKDDICLT